MFLSKSNNYYLFSELLTIPPGFNKGLIFGEDGFTLLSNAEQKCTKMFGDLPKIDLFQLISNDSGTIGENFFLSRIYCIQLCLTIYLTSVFT